MNKSTDSFCRDKSVDTALLERDWTNGGIHCRSAQLELSCGLVGTKGDCVPVSILVKSCVSNHPTSFRSFDEKPTRLTVARISSQRE